MSDLLNSVIARIESADPMHAKKLHKRMATMGADFFENAQRYYADCDEAMQREGKSLAFGVECYLKLCADMQTARLDFLRSGKYANTSYKEVAQAIYGRPEVMDYHMYGLAMAQFLWLDQYERLRFFCDRLPSYRNSIRSYLEIGGGHGLYTRRALDILDPSTRIDLLDISESSLKLAKSMINSPRVNYFLEDLFEWNGEEKFDFISIAEVIEHVEKPDAMLVRVRELLQPGGAVFLTTPVNAPMIDHIYLFRNVQEIRDLVAACGFAIVEDKYAISDDISEEKAIKNKVPVMYAAFLRHAKRPDSMNTVSLAI